MIGEDHRHRKARTSKAMTHSENSYQASSVETADVSRASIGRLKVCGITDRSTAQLCASLGVGALGAVFYAQSPRNLTPDQARHIFAGLPLEIARVGVFVDREAAEIEAIARVASLTAIQLHGSESVATACALHALGYRVIKVLKCAGPELLAKAAAFPAHIGIMVECAAGILPGGNGMGWDWTAAAPLAALRPYALAGGLAPDNIAEALRLSSASACDLSSGVESAPGIKDHSAIRRLVAALAIAPPPPPPPFWSAQAIQILVEA